MWSSQSRRSSRCWTGRPIPGRLQERSPALLRRTGPPRSRPDDRSARTHPCRSASAWAAHVPFPSAPAYRAQAAPAAGRGPAPPEGIAMRWPCGALRTAAPAVRPVPQALPYFPSRYSAELPGLDRPGNKGTGAPPDCRSPAAQSRSRCRRSGRFSAPAAWGHMPSAA